MPETTLFEVKSGEIYRTKWEPGGLVKVLLLESASWPYGETTFVEYVEDHPFGYKHGELGRYEVKDLRPLTV